MDIYHILPTNDLKIHTEVLDISTGVNRCNCECKPTVSFEGDNILIIHNSFDGRENFEPDNVVRNN